VRQLAREPLVSQRFEPPLASTGVGEAALPCAAMAVDTSAVKELAHPKLEALVE
jgi:hypothetical protein